MPHRAAAAGQAHDRNNFLQIALLLTEALQRRSCEDAEGQRMLEGLRQALESLVQMNRFVLDGCLSSRADPPPASAAPDVVIENTAILAKSSDTRDVRIELRLGAKDVVIPVPEIHLQQVLFNLLKNAMEAAPAKGGRVAVESGVQCQSGRDTLRHSHRTLRITITDNGSGIPSECLPQLLKGGFSTKTGGHGLGLQHARRIASWYGATVTLYSSHVFGTRATVLWPLKQSS